MSKKYFNIFCKKLLVKNFISQFSFDIEELHSQRLTKTYSEGLKNILFVSYYLLVGSHCETT